MVRDDITPGRRRTDPASVLRAEAVALSAAADRLDASAYEKAIGLLSACTGKAILSGAGTSGIIARKIAATLTSTGTPALFLHPSDGLHGGLGAVAAEDVVIAVSNSGETDELKVILPYLRHRRVPMIAIVGKLDSSLARAAEVALDARAEHEACPFNLAPTCSSTLALAIGDALAIGLYDLRGLTPEGFALNHPSGSLGRRLTLRVADLMHGGEELPAVAPTAPWLDVVTTVTTGGLGAVVVVDGEGLLLGIVTDGDLRRAMERIGSGGWERWTASDLMTTDPITVTGDDLAFNAMQLMEDRPSQISVLPVVDGRHRCIGLVRVHDVVRAGL